MNEQADNIRTPKEGDMVVVCFADDDWMKPIILGKLAQVKGGSSHSMHGTVK